jgi:hypothetical protein
MNKEEAIKQIPIIQAELDRLKSIIETPERISKEERFYEIVKELTQKIDKEKYPNSLFYFKGDDPMFEIEDSKIWVSKKNVWSVFEREYCMEHIDIKTFISIQAEEPFNRKGLTPIPLANIYYKQVKQHFKRKELTPRRNHVSQ